MHSYITLHHATNLYKSCLLTTYGKIPKLGETSIQNKKGHESLENITNSMLQVEFFTLKNFDMREIYNINSKIWEKPLNSEKHKDAK